MSYIFRLICFFFLVGCIGSCKIAETPTLPPIKEVPETFIKTNDSASIGDIPREKFFTDPKLVELIDIAVENNPNLQIAIQRIEIARAHYQVGRGALYPTLDAITRTRSGDLQPNLLNNTIHGDKNVANRVQQNFVGFQSIWEADLWGKLRSRRKAAFSRFLASEKGRHLVTTALVAEVASLYYELLRFDNELQIIQKNIEFQEIALEMIKIQKIGGKATELAVQQFNAQLLRTQSLLYEKQQQIIEVENRLNLLLGRYPQEIERGESILHQQLPEMLDAGVPFEMLLKRPDVMQAELELLASSADLEAARAEFLPSIVITPYMGLNAGSFSSLLSVPETLVFGFLTGITAPLFNRFWIKSNHQSAVARNKIAFHNYQNALYAAYQEVVNSLNRIENYKQVYELRVQETEVLLDAVSTSNDLFSAGYATYLEVITAQERVLEAELGKTNKRKEVFLSVIDLYRALGGGWR